MRARAIVRRAAIATALLFSLAPPATGSTDELPKLRRRPSPMGAMARSTVVPGWGQWYVGRKPKGVVLALAATAVVWQGIEAHRDGREKDRQKLTVWGSVLWLYAMTDAYVGAHLSRFEEEMRQAQGGTRPPDEER
jgi:hypothetical protein